MTANYLKVLNQIQNLDSDIDKICPIVEIYPCLQFEGQKVGVPHLLVRTTGCTHRCFFGEKGGWCDSPYTSITPEKGSFSLRDFLKMVYENPHITHLMITGGSPTMHPKLVNDLIKIVKHANKNYFVTLETEGSHMIKTDHRIDLLSLSPKFSNSVPVLGTPLPSGRSVNERYIELHNSYRLKIDTIKEMIHYHLDYQFKPVVDPDNQQLLDEIQSFMFKVGIPREKTYFMPAGSTREELILAYPKLIELCVEEGYNFTGRDHIIAYDQKRGV